MPTVEERARALWDALFSEDAGQCDCMFPDMPDPKCLAAIAAEIRAANHQAREEDCKAICGYCAQGWALDTTTYPRRVLHVVEVEVGSAKGGYPDLLDCSAVLIRRALADERQQS